MLTGLKVAELYQTRGYGSIADFKIHDMLTDVKVFRFFDHAGSVPTPAGSVVPMGRQNIFFGRLLRRKGGYGIIHTLFCDRLRIRSLSRVFPFLGNVPSSVVAGNRRNAQRRQAVASSATEPNQLTKTKNKGKKTMIDKAAVRSEFGRHDRDTGSSEVQIATLTKEIQALTEHLKQNKKDHSSRYGLLRKVNNRRKLLDYLKREDEAKYKDLIKKLGLRR